jgi:hypothetical protein
MDEVERQIEALKEQNRYEGDWIKLLILLFVTVGGGTARLVLAEEIRTLDMIFAGFGGLFILGIVSTVLVLHRNIHQRIRAMREG